MKTRKEIEDRIDTLEDVITFATILRLPQQSINNLRSFIEILKWVLNDDKTVIM